jgi:hypothetical protein
MSELIRRLDPHRFRVHVGCFRRTGAWLPRVETVAEEVAQFRLRSFKSPASLATLWDFAAWLRARDIAVVQACDLYANVFALPGAALAQVPVRIGARREWRLPTRHGLTSRPNASHIARRTASSRIRRQAPPGSSTKASLRTGCS